MKTNDDVARGWVRKAEADLLALKLTLRSEARDVACFHAQQAAEKMLKAYLIHKDRDFSFTHDLTKLINVAADLDPAFRKFLPSAKKLTPYAVQLRYDCDFFPTLTEARSACRNADAIARFILARMCFERPARAQRRPKRR
jgi:HEPN domain-containing protein